ncbi:putative nuclease HARBI1 [Juglans microcarpa x Juglans regia]|uniref:putative nuclease HARBI1 n=1 Tax=Juglans microcarpa x Juglans regia TaxID=2249226 RepID=UPI001B7F44AB|nr:putative nuclease HARBI1 [Juglans microcarpa x Juglans regia]
MDNDSDAWNDDDNIEENDTSEEGSSSNASSTFDFETWAEWYAWSRRNDVLNGHPDTCYEMFRMEVDVFRALCNRLHTNARLRDSSREVTVEEALGMFCYTVGHGVVQRNAANLFQHSVETINRHVYHVMRALCRLSRRVIKPSQTTGVMPYIEGNPRHYPWFEKCHGAMDRVMIDAAAPASVANAYLNRYHRITQNVMCVCDFEMKFTFVYAGWEGTAHDARVLIDALRRPGNHFPWPEEGYYYLVDSAFPCTEGFMPPYPRVRYHRSERRGSHTFQGYKDLFNYRHSSLRNVIERTFGVLKKRFRILNLMPPYLPTRQRYLIIACCTIHNFIRMVTPNDRDFLVYSNPDDYPGMDANQNTSEETHVPDMSIASAQAMAARRDAIALPMWGHSYGQQGNT